MRQSNSEIDGFLELFWRHGPAIRNYLVRRAGRQAAEDLLGEVWLRAFRSRRTFDPTRAQDPLPWLYGIARHTLRAHWDQPSNRPEPALGSVVLDPWPDVDNRLEAAAALPALKEALAQLSVDDREVLLLVVWERLTPAEVAIAIGVPQGTARSRLHRARTTLRALLDTTPTVDAHEEV